MAARVPKVLGGPLAVFSLFFGIGWIALGVAMVLVQILGRYGIVLGIVAIVAGLATFVLGWSSTVRVRDDGLRYNLRGHVPWAKVASIEVDREGRGWAPVLLLPEGRGIGMLVLDGLVASRDRAIRRANVLAEAAGGIEVDVREPEPKPDKSRGPRHAMDPD